MGKGLVYQGLYTETAEAGAHKEAEVAVFVYSAYGGVLFAPLHRCNFEADLVVVYGNSAQVMHLVTAALWKEGGRIVSSFLGRLD